MVYSPLPGPEVRLPSLGRRFRLPSVAEIVRREIQGNDLTVIPSLARELVQKSKDLAIVDDRGAAHLQIVLEEALINAVVHGNLEVPSSLKDGPIPTAYRDAITLRQRLAPWCERTVRIEAILLPHSIRVRIQDEGPGFNPREVRDATLPENLDQCHGRGLAMMRAFADRVCFNARGNAVTIYKRRAVPQSDRNDDTATST